MFFYNNRFFFYNNLLLIVFLVLFIFFNSLWILFDPLYGGFQFTISINVLDLYIRMGIDAISFFFYI